MTSGDAERMSRCTGHAAVCRMIASKSEAGRQGGREEVRERGGGETGRVGEWGGCVVDGWE